MAKLSNRDRIEIDFARAMERAQEMEEIACEMVSIARTGVPETLQLIGGGFGGENGAAFYRKGSQLEPSFFETAQRLLKAAESVRFTAELIYRAEKGAEKIF